jgi:hypothetical protein
MKIKNRKIAARCWTGISARGPTLLAWLSGPAGTARTGSPRGGHASDDVVVRPARLRRRPRCSAPDGDSMGDQWQLRRARWGGRVLNGDGRWQWGDENSPARRRSKAAVELRWSRRASTSPAARGEDGRGEARSKKGG